MDEPTHKAPRHREVGDDGVKRHHGNGPHGEKLWVVAEERQVEISRPAAGEVGHHEISRDDEKSLLPGDVRDALPEIPAEALQGAHAIRRRCLVHVGLLILDGPLKGRRREKTQSVEKEQRRHRAQPVIDHGGDGGGHGGDGPEHAGDRVGLGVVPLRDEVGVEAVVGHHVDTVDGADEQRPRQQEGIAEPAAPHHEVEYQEDKRRQEIQTVDDLLPAHAVQHGSRQQGTYQHRDLEADVE